MLYFVLGGGKSSFLIVARRCIAKKRPDRIKEIIQH